MKKNFG